MESLTTGQRGRHQLAKKTRPAGDALRSNCATARADYRDSGGDNSQPPPLADVASKAAGAATAKHMHSVRRIR